MGTERHATATGGRWHARRGGVREPSGATGPSRRLFPPARLHVVGDPGDALVGAVAEVDDRGHDHRLEVPWHRPVLLLDEDGAARRALAVVGQVLVLDDLLALLAPRHGAAPP